MPTKLSRYFVGVMEAAWLTAIIVVPVFFNIYSSRIFEPDKLTLLRTLALVILAAWVVKLIEEGRPQWENIEPGESCVKSFLRVPLVLPVLALVVVYIIATIFSITPNVSLLGSYQRLQGTYTTFSYLVVFAAIAVNLRKREQVERLIGAAIIASLPVSLYGVLQRFQIDPIPWGGETSSRVASNMGNSIFVAAFLIMVFPLTAIRIVESFEALLQDRGRLGPNFVRATGYVFIIALQAITIYFTGSRGPWLGWGASLIFIWLGLSLIWRKRALTIAGVVLAVLASIFLITLNIPNGPLENLRSTSQFRRLGQLLDTESRTGRVRTYIWQGASELVQPHEPLEFPDGTEDRLNFLRPVIGYGPESMYVAYNRYYPPELTQVEKRNASPDRSHNETWDSLVITGVLGLAVYLTLFGAVLYYGLKWLGLVRSKRQRNLFLILYLIGGLVSSIIVYLWQGVGYLGVALPFGMVLGVIIYLILTSLFGQYEPPETPGEKIRAYALLGLVAVVVAHFVEINFGIAIAATRTYFWVATGLLLVIGYVLPKSNEYVLASSPVGQDRPGENGKTKEASPRKDRKRSKKTSTRKRRSSTKSRTGFPLSSQPKWLREALIVGFVISVLLITLGFDYVSNAQGGGSAFELLWTSVTRLEKTNISYGVLALFLTSWLVGTLVMASESVQNIDEDDDTHNALWGKMLLVALAVSFAVALIYWLWHASGLLSLTSSTATTLDDLVEQVGRSEGILTKYYIYLMAVLFVLAGMLPASWPAKANRFGVASYAAPAVALIIAFSLASYTNLRVIQADMAFKTADLFARNKSWPVAIEIYNRANDLAPNEDYYYLFLGRAYLEHARSLDDLVERDRFIAQSADDLLKAQAINPLNTDHTANLARLHSLWASYATEPAIREERAQTSDDYFAKAVSLSPNNARLWGEWATLYLNILKQPEEALERLEQALEIDPNYEWTYGLLGDYYSRFIAATAEADSEEREDAYITAADYYSRALSIGGDQQERYGYAVSMGGSRGQAGDIDGAIEAYNMALELAPGDAEVWRIYETLARLCAQKGDLTCALDQARYALEAAPEDQKERVRSLIGQLGGQE